MEIWKDIPNYEGYYQANKFIGKYKGYLSEQIIKNNFSNKSYRWELV